MRWRFMDRIESIEPWQSAEGIKAISFEEYSLGKPFGRKGILPEGIVLESCIHMIRWLVIKSSNFRNTCVLKEIERFAFDREAGMGDVLHITVRVMARDDTALKAECAVKGGGHDIASGAIAVEFLPLDQCMDPEAACTMWKEVHGPT